MEFSLVRCFLTEITGEGSTQYILTFSICLKTYQGLDWLWEMDGWGKAPARPHLSWMPCSCLKLLKCNPDYDRDPRKKLLWMDSSLMPFLEDACHNYSSAFVLEICWAQKLLAEAIVCVMVVFFRTLFKLLCRWDPTTNGLWNAFLNFFRRMIFSVGLKHVLVLNACFKRSLK